MLDSDATGFEELPSFLESRDSLTAWTFQSAGDAGPNASVAIIDAQLLFHADFKRTGDDLTLIGDDGNVHVVAGYFKSDVLATMQSSNGASLKGDVIAALAGPRAAGQYASATKHEPSAQAIGQVAKLEGHATVIRNGVPIVLNVGDAVLKGDVVQTDSSGTVGILFKDGSVFQITPDSRLVLSDFAYDAHGSANVEEFNLVQGSFSFVSGAIAKTGHMRIGTPVATMKIDGTAGGGDVGSNNGEVTLYIFRQGDGEHKASILDQNGNVIATLTSEGGKLVLTPTGPSQFDSHVQGKTPADFAAELIALENMLKFKSVAGSGLLADAQPQSTKQHGSSSPLGGPATLSVSPDDTAPPSVVIPVTIVIPPANTPAGNSTVVNPVGFAAPVDHKTYVSEDSYTLNEDGILAVLPNGVLANDSTRDGSSLTAIIDVDPQHGSLTFNPDGSFLYTPVANFNGTDTFTYHATNGTTTSDPVTVTLVVNSVNDAPVVVVGTSPVAAQEQTAVLVVPALTLADIDSTTLAKATVQITGNYHAAEDVLSFTDTVKIHGVFDTATGTLTLTAIAGQSPTLADFQTALQSVTYTDTSDAPSTLPRTLTVTVQDPDGTAHLGQDSASGVVTLNVTAVNDAPVITGATAPLDQTEALNASTQDILPISGTLTVLDPDVGDTLTASITGNAVIKLNGSTTLPPGVNLSALGLASNIHIAGATSDGGSKELTWTYDPGAANLDFLNDSDVLTITYTAHVSDGTVDSNTQTLTVTINGVNDAAVITSAVVDLTETDAIQTAGGTLAITDVDNPATFVAQSNVAGTGNYGLFTIGTNGVWSYAMDSAHNEFKAGVTYTDMLTVMSADGTTSSITINIVGTDDAAVIAPTTVNLYESDAVLTTGGTITIVDPDNSPTFVAQTNVTGSGGYGHFTLAADGVWTYATDSAHNEFIAGTTYTDTLNVAGTDGTTSTITVNMAGTNDAPELLGDLAASVTRSQAYTLTTNDLNASDPDDTTSTFTVSNLQHGTIKVNGATATTFTQTDVAAGHVSFVQDGTANTTASFSVTVEDGNEDLSTPVASTFHFDVTLPPEPQTIAPSSVAAGTEDQTTGVAIVLSGTDPTGSVSSYNITSLSHGQLYKDAGLSQLITGNVAATGNAANNFTTTVYFKPAANFDGAASFQFAAVNNFGTDDTTPATAQIDIAPVVDAPTFAFGRGDVSLILNGGFDSGLSGWTTTFYSIGGDNFFTTAADTITRIDPGARLIYHFPQSGDNYALVDPTQNSGTSVLQQSFLVPYALENLKISFDFFVARRFTDAHRDYVGDGTLTQTSQAAFGRIDLLNANSATYDTSAAAVFNNLFIGTTFEGDGVSQVGPFNIQDFLSPSWTHLEYSTTGVTSDQSYVLRFANVSTFNFPEHMGIDRVSVTAKVGSVGFENQDDVVIGKIALGDTDGSEHVTKLVLSGFVAGTVFKLNGVQVGALDTTPGSATLGKWVISDQAALDALAITDLTATPPADYLGSFNITSEATITDSVTNSSGQVVSASQTFTDTLKVEILTPNHAPTAADARIAVNEDSPRALTASDFSFSDTDSDAFQAVKIIDLPEAGTLKLNGVAVTAGQTIAISDIASGRLVYTPPVDTSGTAISSLTFQVQDDGGGGGHDATHVGTDLSLTHTLTLDVKPVADVPVFLTPAATTRAGDEDSVINLGTLDISKTDPSETLKVAISGFPAGSIFQIDGLQVGALDTTPGSATLGQWVITSQSEIASLHDRALQFVPAANANGNISLSIAARTTDSAVVNGVTVTDTSAPVTKTISVTVNSVNDNPVGHDDYASINEDASLTITKATLLANDTDVDLPAQTLSVTGVSGASGGSVVLTGNNAVFTPTSGFSGIAGFDYAISDNAGGTGSAHVTIDVKPLADHPVYTVNGTGNEDTGVVVGKIALGDNDGSEHITKIVLSGFAAGSVFTAGNTQVGALDVDINSATYNKWVITDPAEIVSLSTNNLTVQTPLNYNGVFTLTAVSSVTDTATLTTGAASNSATFTDTIQITVNPVNDAPVVAHALVSQITGQSAPFVYQFASNTFNDVDSDTLTYSPTLANGDPLPAWLSFDSATRTFSGSPPNAETLHINVVASDGTVSATSTFDIVVNANHAPTAANVTFSFSYGDESIVTLSGSDQEDGTTLSYKLTHIPVDAQVYLDSQHLIPVTENQVFTGNTLYVLSSSLDFSDPLTYVAIDSYSTESAPKTASATPAVAAIFTGTSGNDVADASTGTITGFTTGGTVGMVGQLRDIVGDIFLPGDGEDTIVGGRGNDIFRFTSATNFSSGDSFNGGAGGNAIDITDIANADIRGVNYANIQSIVGGDADNRLSLTLGQFSSLAAINLGNGVDRVDVYLPASFDAVGTPTNYDISGIVFPGLYNVESVYLMGGADNQSVTLSYADARRFSGIDLGAGTNDTLIINSGLALYDTDVTLLHNITNVENVIYTGVSHVGSRYFSDGHSGHATLTSTAGSDLYWATDNSQYSVTGMPYINAVSSGDNIVFSYAGDVITFAHDGSFERVLTSWTRSHVLTVAPGLESPDNGSYLLVGTDAGETLTTHGSFNMVFGGGGDDTLTGDGTDDTFYGGTGNDLLKSLSVSSTNYVFSFGDGSDVIDDAGAGPRNLGGRDRVVIDTQGAALTTFSIDHILNTNDLKITYNGGDVTFLNAFNANNTNAINFNSGTYKGYNLGFYDYVITDPAHAISTQNGNNGLIIIGTNGVSNTMQTQGAVRDIYIGGDRGDTLITYGGGDLLFGGGGSDNFTFAYQNTSPSNNPTVIADFMSGVDAIDLSPISRFEFGSYTYGLTTAIDWSMITVSIDADHNTIVHVSVPDAANTQMVIKLLGEHTLTADDFIFQNIAATFTGTSGNDVADANARTLSGFTGGNLQQVVDVLGDTYIPGDGDDVIHAGNGADTLKITSSSNLSAGDVFDGGANGPNQADIIDITGAGDVDFRVATILNFEGVIANDYNANHVVKMWLDQLPQFGSVWLYGSSELDVYLPSSINSSDLATAPVLYDMTAVSIFPRYFLTNSIAVLYATGSGNQSIKLSGSQANFFNVIDLGDGDQDALTVVASADFSLNDSKFVNIEKMTIVDGAGSDTLIGSNNSDAIYGNDGDDIITGNGGDDYLDGGSGRNAFNFGANDGHDTVAYAAGGMRDIVVAGSHMDQPSVSLNITHLGLDGLQISYGNTTIDLLNYSDADRLLPSGPDGPFNNQYNFLYHSQSSPLNFHVGSHGTNYGQVLVGVNGGDTVDGAGYSNLMFGGDGNDTITGGNVLAGVDATLLGSSDIYVGGKGDDLLINYGVGDPNYAGSASDTYVFNIGDGHDTIKDYGGGDIHSNLYGDRILIDTKGAAFTTFSMTHDPLAASGGDDLVINYSANDSITVWEQFAGNGHSMEFINFNGASYDGYNFGNIDYTINKAGVPPLTGLSGGVVVVGDLNADNVLQYRSYNGNAVLIGGNQSDRLDFDAGGGLMIGGGGADTFVFARAQASSVPSVIADFQDGIDKIDMHGQYGLYNSQGQPLDFSSLTITQTADATLVHADVFGGTIDFKLHGLHYLTANDFLLA